MDNENPLNEEFVEETVLQHGSHISFNVDLCRHVPNLEILPLSYQAWLLVL